VQRHTLYAHFPDERTLLLACSGLTMERDPPPDAEPWQTVADPAERLRRGLSELYEWYARNAALLGCVLRDAEHHELTREIAGLRFGPYMAAYRQVLGAELSAPQRALLEVALSYFTWRSLTGDGGQDTPTAAATIAEALIRLG
jgi:AcrR family transcriptional regulator